MKFTTKQTQTQPRVLFVLRTRPAEGYGSWGYSQNGSPLPSGMSVSVRQIISALEAVHIESKMVQLDNNNFIHQEVQAYRPTHVIIEGFWVVPDKFKVLQALNPEVEFSVRCHSNTEFLAHEGTVFGWALDYLEQGITVSFNSPTAARSIKELLFETGRLNPGRVVYLPNYYDFEADLSLFREILKRLLIIHTKVKHEGQFHVGCFGAIRPLKNNMNQALAAIKVANRMGLVLKFYINSNRVENKGDALLVSLRSLFARSGPHQLVEIPWMEHKDFMVLLLDMDIVTQVSNSETFNIVLADAVAASVPAIGAHIPWLDQEYQADPNDVQDIAVTMHRTWLKSGNGSVQDNQKRGLAKYVQRSLVLWETYLRTSGHHAHQ